MAQPSEQPPLSQPDVAAILAALRGEVRAQRLAQGQLELTPLERDLQRSLDEIELHRVVSAHWPLIGTNLPQAMIALVNKLVRRYLRWYINPIVEQQNAYNDAVARALRLLAEAYIDLGEQIVAAGAGGGPPAAPPTAGPAAAAPAPGSRSAGELMALVRARAAAEPPTRFPDLEFGTIEPQLRLHEQVSAHWPLVGASLRQRVVVLVNKLVRRYLRWYINPIVEQQNAANAAITAALLAGMHLDAERRAEVASLRGQGSGIRSRGLLAPDS